MNQIQQAGAGRCELCGGQVMRRIATQADPYSFELLSGLRSVYLLGIAVERCGKCGVESPTIPKQADLERAIVQHLLGKETQLTGDEVRYLRKSAGISAKDFAQRIGVDASHLSRVENGKPGALGTPTDKLVRAIAAAELASDDARVSWVLAQPAVSEKPKKTQTSRMAFNKAKNRWAEAA